MPMQLTDKPTRGRALPAWIQKLPAVRNLKPSKLLSMKDIAEHCGITPPAASSVLKDLLTPSKKELVGRRWVEMYLDDDVAALGDQYNAGKKWRDNDEPRIISMDFEVISRGKKIPFTAIVKGIVRSSQHIIHVSLDQSSCDHYDLADDLMFALHESVSLTELAPSLIVVQTESNHECSILVWKIVKGKVDTTVQRIDPFFCQALLSERP